MATVPKKKPPAKKAPAPAKDLKPGDSRSSYLKKKAPNASSGTLTERMGEVKNRPNKGLPARTGQARGNLNRAITPDKINLGGQGGTSRSMTKAGYLDKFKPIPLGNSPKLLAGPALKAARIGLGGPATAVTAIVDPNFMNWKSERVLKGELDAAKPSGKLFSPSANRAAGKGNPKAVNPYQAAKAKIPARGEARGGMKSTLESYRASKAAKSSVSMAGGGVNKIDTAKDKMKRQQQGRKPDKKVTSIAPSQQGSGKVTKMPEAKFKGNWVGAVPTEMQKRGGQKIMRPNLLDLIRRKK